MSNLAGVDSLQHCPVACIQIGGHGEHIVSRLEGIHGHASGVLCIETNETGHIQGICHHDALEAELVLQQTCDNCRRRRGHAVAVRIKRKHSHVRGHDGVDSRSDRLSERR